MPCILILAGGDISRKLPYVKASCGCPALIPINTRPLASYVIEAYRQASEIHLFVGSEFVEEVRRELPPRKHHYKLHGLPPTNGVVGSLRKALESIPDSGDVVVNLVTTIPTRMPSRDEILVANQPAHTSTEWSVISSGPESLSFYPKGSERPPDALAFTGVFRLDSETLRKTVETSKGEKDLINVLKTASTLKKLTIGAVEWIDCGHETNYFRSRAQLVNSRSFNRLKVDGHRGIITKSSENKLKLAREVSYFETLPLSLRILFPRLLGQSGGSTGVESYEMEYYGYPNLAEYLLYWELSKESWWRCFDSLNDTLNLFRIHPASIGPTRYHEFHWAKTIDRIDSYFNDLKDLSLRDALESQSILLNGRRLAPLPELLGKAEKIISSGYRETVFGVFHGDFCFNNILFDVNSGIVRLIDPRGSFGDACPGIYGDYRYDLAKLSHSSIGRYDYFVNGLFDVWVDSSGSFRLETVLRPNAAWLEEMTRWLISEQAADPLEIEVMTALLFLSMCPLHRDDTNRQLAFFLRGMELLHQAFTS